MTYYGNNIYQESTGKYFITEPYTYFNSIAEAYDFIDKNDLHKF